MKFVEPRLENLVSIQNGGVSMIYGDIGLSQMLPLSLLGDGMLRLASILLRIADASRGIVLIDEVENGLHRLDLINGKIDAVVYNEEALTNAIKADFDVKNFIKSL